MGIKVWAQPLISGLAISIALMVSGCGSGSPSMSNTSTATPTFSPGAGSYNSSQAVTISDSTSGAVLYCTTDGSTPTTSSPKCSQPTTVYHTQFLQAIAVAPSSNPSVVASAAYTINLSAAATPAFSPAGGSFASAQTVTISDATTGANIYYTIDGSTPSASSTLYTGPVAVSTSETISAIAVASGYSNSGIASATYNISASVATPAFSIPSGSYTSAQTVTITDATANAAIYYTTDGSTPSSASTAYSSPISVTQTEVISAIAILGNLSSAVSIAAYTIGGSNGGGGGAPLAPVFSLVAGTYTSPQTVSLSDATANAVIYYTTDGSAPSAASTAYTASINVATTETISAIAILAGASSAIVTATYTISLPVAAPVFSVPSGNYAAAQSVSLTDATAGAAIYYTLDGSTPDSSSTAYTTPINVTQNEVISAIAILGASSSPVVNAAYTITTTIAAPVFSVPTGSYLTTQTVTITDATPNATIYYAINNTAPTTASTIYTGAITVTQTQSVSAIAVLGVNSSAVSTVAYAISATVPPPTFDPVSGSNVAVGQLITIAGGNANTAIYYTTDGTTPTSGSTKYTAPIPLTQIGAAKIEAVAIDTGTSSAVAIATYTVKQPTPVPTFTPMSGSPFVAGQAVTIADTDATATIYYTLDGSTPNAASTKYAAPIPLTTTGIVTVNAVAIDAGVSSVPAMATYTVSPASVDPPTFTPASGATLTSGATVTIVDTDADATIYYTTDGSLPGAGSTKYTGPIAFTTPGPATIMAIAIDGATSSPVAAGTYTVAGSGNSISGTVLSGTTPIKGAMVQAYAAGIAAGDAGYGSTATALGSPIATSASGAFTLNVNCPASPGDLIYLVATGGDSGNGANTSISLMTALGACANTAGATVTINEATTVASAYALAQFMTTAPHVGSSSNNYPGLTNAFATVGNLVNVTTGASLTHTPGYSQTFAQDTNIVNNSTVPQARIDTLANMLNACTASAGSGCTALFTAATPPAGSEPTATLQAILDIAQTPGTNPTTRFSAASPSGPFQPVLGAAPNDWTLALTFTGGGLGIVPNTTAKYTGDDGSSFTGTLALINTSLAIGGNGNVLVLTYADNTPIAPAYSNSVATRLAEFDNQGAPITAATTLSGASVIFGGFLPDPQYYLANTTSSLSAIAVDQAGNIWLSDTDSGNLFEVSPDLTLLLPAPPTASSGTGGDKTASMAIDSAGNIWLGTHPKIFEFNSAGTQVIESAGTQPYQLINSLVFDSNLGLWAADSDASDTYQVSTTDGSVLFDAFNGMGFNAGVTLAADGSGNVYGCAESGGENLDVFSSGAQTHSIPIGGLNDQRGCGTQLVLDGQGHLFAVSNTDANAPLMTVDEFTVAGSLVSPANGYTGTSLGEPPTLNPDFNVFPANEYPGITAAIDSSGNLWVLNNDTNGYAVPGNVLVKFIGIGAPVVTPTSVALKNGQLGMRP